MTQCMTRIDEQTLLVFERIILRTTFGDVKLENNWRRRFSHGSYKLYGEPDLVNYIKINSSWWLCHVLRMEEECVPLKMLNGYPDGSEESRKAQKKVERRRRIEFKKFNIVEQYLIKRKQVLSLIWSEKILRKIHN